MFCGLLQHIPSILWEKYDVSGIDMSKHVKGLTTDVMNRIVAEIINRDYVGMQLGVKTDFTRLGLSSPLFVIKVADVRRRTSSRLLRRFRPRHRCAHDPR